MMSNNKQMDVYEQLLKEREFNKSVIEGIPNPFFYKDNKGVYKLCNDMFSKVVGLPKEKIIGHKVFDISEEESANRSIAIDRQIYETKERITYEDEYKYINREKYHVVVHKAPHIDNSGKVVGIIGIIQDITGTYENEKKLDKLYQIKDAFLSINKNILKYKSEEEFFDSIQGEMQKVFEACEQSSVLSIDDDEIMTILVSRGFVEEKVKKFSLRYKDSYVYNKSDGGFSKVLIINDIQDFIEKDKVKIVESKTGIRVESTIAIPIVIENKLKFILSMDSIENNVYTEADRVIAEYIREELPIIYRVFYLHRQTLHLTKYDGLTGLLNRRAFDKITEGIIDHSGKSIVPVLIVIIDLDKLKYVNDNIGHLAGDKYIITMKDFLENCQNDDIIFSRIGGDEFAGVIRGMNINEARNLFLEMQRKFNQEEIYSDEQCFKGNFSFGIAQYGVDGHRKSTLMRIADTRMYEDKASNKRGIEVIFRESDG